MAKATQPHKYKGTPEQVKALRMVWVRAVAKFLPVVERQTLPEWADNYRVLSGKDSARPGPWRTNRVAVARGPMLAADEPGVETISLMVATQLLKTAYFLNIIGRYAHTDPCPILVVYPNEDAAQAFSKERLAPMVAATPVLRERFAKPRSRDYENTIEVKHFPGGFVAMVSAASEMNLSARPVRVVLLDEIDKYKPTKGGDPIELAEERSSTFNFNRLSIRASSPTGEETSRIWASYQQSDQRKPYIECPKCKFLQYPEFFRHVHWQKQGGQHRPETAGMFCEACNYQWSEPERLQSLRQIRWLQTKTFICCNEGQDPRVNRLWDWSEEFQVGYALCKNCGERAVDNSHAGFTASKLFSPYITIPKLAAKWLEAERDPETKQAFYNTQLAIPFKTQATKEIASKTVQSRLEDYLHVPDAAVAITIGVDVQPQAQGGNGRLECETVAWSETEESWSLDYSVFIGDPAQREVWQQLDEYLLRHWQREDGRKMRVLASCIDSGGHNTEDVYKFCFARRNRNVWAIKGASDRGGQWSPVWPARQWRMRQSARDRLRPVMIGVNAAKEAIRQRLLIEDPGPGFCHFPTGRPPGYFDQLTAERLVIERKSGIMVRRWDCPKHMANEALDARVYAYAAFQGLKLDRGFNPGRVARMLAPAPEPEAEEMPQPRTILAQPEPAQPWQPQAAPPFDLAARAAAQAAPAVREFRRPGVAMARPRIVRSRFMSSRGPF